MLTKIIIEAYNNLLTFVLLSYYNRLSQRIFLFYSVYNISFLTWMLLSSPCPSVWVHEIYIVLNQRRRWKKKLFTTDPFFSFSIFYFLELKSLLILSLTFFLLSLPLHFLHEKWDTWNWDTFSSTWKSEILA